MPANVGRMFYYGDVPWHGEGKKLDKPATLEVALLEGGLNWIVARVGLQTCDPARTSVFNRQAIVRTDIPAGNPNRVLGVVHRGFRPIQNQEGADLFDQLLKPHKAV